MTSQWKKQIRYKDYRGCSRQYMSEPGHGRLFCSVGVSDDGNAGDEKETDEGYTSGCLENGEKTIDEFVFRRKHGNSCSLDPWPMGHADKRAGEVEKVDHAHVSGALSHTSWNSRGSIVF